MLDPCNPSPCGPNAICRSVNGNAVCECPPNYFGNPSTSGCRPECVISSDCPRNRACVNTRCVDPCPGVCGYNAVCQVINHSPVCSCPQPLMGDPFVECKKAPGNVFLVSFLICKFLDVPYSYLNLTSISALPVDPCNPSPCNINGQCRVVSGQAVCIYPECIINQDCSRDKACYEQRCRNPCIDACGLNAICDVVNHSPVCSCPTGYEGNAKVSCRVRPPEGKFLFFFYFLLR